ncbi:permease [Carnobacterium sp. AT7]|uniref:MFS transporter n=1 Tax=Carnobacterium sp. AT7 TaxID=333990 RepID=UPI00015F1387|nr:MFS transporter [Carnobacterium sp. AT7]EDP67554.1 permease [Carnobacterium sp. AT7]
MLSSFSKNIQTTLVTSFFSSLVYACTIPYLIIYLSGIFSSETLGLLVMINVVSSFLAGIVGGYLADNFQRKKILMIFQNLYGVSLFIVALNFTGLLPQHFWLIGGYLICGITYNLYYSAFDAVLLDSTVPNERKKVYQLQYWTFNLSMALGASIGGFLFKHYLVYLFLGAALLQFVVSAFLQKELSYKNKVSHKKGKTIFHDLFTNYYIAAKDKRWVILILGIALYSAAEFSLQNYTGIRLSKEFNPITLFSIPIDGVRMLSLLQVINTIMVVCFTFVVSRLTEKKNERTVVIVGLFVYVTGYSLMASANSIYLLIPLAIIATIGELASAPILNARQVNLIPEDKQASYLSFASLSFQGSQLLAALGLTLGGYLAAGLISGYIIILGVAGIYSVVSSLYGTKKTVKYD